MHMIEMLKKRREDGEEGFTLIELMVVVLIIAILIAIAIPTFLGAQDRARDRAAQSDLRNALTAAKTVAVDYEGIFTKDGTAAIDASAMETAEPALNFGISPDDATAVSFITVAVSNGSLAAAAGTPVNGVMLMHRKSSSGKTFGICADSKGNVRYSNPGGTTTPTLTNCNLAKF